MTTITLRIADHVEQELNGFSPYELETLLRDALAEFITHRGRGNAEAYVNERYPDNSVYRTEADRAAKVTQTRRRFQAARVLHTSRVTITVGPDPEGEPRS